MRQRGDHPEKKDAQENKGQQESHHKGGPNGSNQTKMKHKHDDSDGAEKNTTKKQENSV